MKRGVLLSSARREGGGVAVRNAYCSECATRVNLTSGGECPNGHPRSALRDVRDGEVATVAAPPAGGGPNLSDSEEKTAWVIGKLVVVVPAAAVVAFGLWTGYAASMGLGMSNTAAWLSSIGSLALTGACVAAIVWMKRHKL